MESYIEIMIYLPLKKEMVIKNGILMVNNIAIMVYLQKKLIGVNLGM
jgi:hypothetical protein